MARKIRLNDRWFTYKFTGWVDVNSGVSVSPATVTVGQNFTVAFSLKEYRGGTTAFEYVELWIQNSAGGDLYRAQRWDNVSFAANQQQSFSATTFLDPAQGRGAGTYRAMVRGKVAGENPFNFGVVPDSGAVNPRTFTAVAPAGWVDVNSGVSVSPATVTVGQNFTVAFSLKEYRGGTHGFRIRGAVDTKQRRGRSVPRPALGQRVLRGQSAAIVFRHHLFRPGPGAGRGHLPSDGAGQGRGREPLQLWRGPRQRGGQSEKLQCGVKFGVTCTAELFHHRLLRKKPRCLLP